MARPAHHLATLVEQVTSSALSSGALSPNRTRGHALTSSGAVWSVRVLETLKKKAAATAAQRGQQSNPFLPHEPDLFVCNLSETHKLLLNKFPVNRGHVLVCTRDFVEQREPLRAADFEATALCVHALGGIAFYNFGIHSGRSQPHKHVQVREPPPPPSPPALAARAGVVERVAAHSAPQSTGCTPATGRGGGGRDPQPVADAAAV